MAGHRDSGPFALGAAHPPDGDGFLLTDGKTALQGPFIRAHVTHHVFVDLDGGRRRLGVTKNNPPVTGGFFIDTFEYPESPQQELLAEAERRNGPLRIQYANGELGESFPANASGLDDAHMLCSALAKRGGQIRLVTSGGVWVKRWNESGAAFKYVHIDHGTPYDAVWRLSDDADGALMRIPFPSNTMTPKLAEQAFASAVFPMIVETSDDEGKTWVHHPHEAPKRD